MPANMLTKHNTLLEQLEERVAVDADTYDADFIATLSIVPHDATSNQGFIHAALVDERNVDIVERTVRELKGQSWENVYAVCVARIAAKVLPVISGRVLVQVSTRHAYSANDIIDDARRYARAFNAEHIPNERFCIKIPVTSAGMAAATALHSEGIATLGTALFSVHQALAASQAGMYAISLYLNEPRAHTEVAMWPDVADPATEAPMAARHVQIRSIYNQLAKATGKPQPQMKTASFCVPADVLACASLGADHVTVGIPVLSDLNAFSTLPDYRSGMWQVPFTEQARSDDGSRVWHTWVPRKWADPEIQALLAHDPLSAVPKEEWKLPNPHGNYLAPGVVDALNEADPATRDRLKFALAMFTGMEEQSRVFLEGRQAKLNA